MDFFKAISVLVRASAKDAATAGSWKIVQSATRGTEYLFVLSPMLHEAGKIRRK